MSRKDIRHIEAKIVHEGYAISLDITLPVPDDAFVRSNSISCVNSSLSETKVNFELPVERRLVRDYAKTVYFPHERSPLWVIYLFQMEEPKEAETLVTDVDLFDLIMKNAEPQPRPQQPNTSQAPWEPAQQAGEVDKLSIT